MNFQFVVPIRMGGQFEYRCIFHFGSTIVSISKKEKGKKYRYLSIGNFLRFFVSYINALRNNFWNKTNFASCRTFPWKIIINNYFDCLFFNSNVSDENVRAAVVPSERNHLHEQWGTERWWDEMRREKGISNRSINAIDSRIFFFSFVFFLNKNYHRETFLQSLFSTRFFR